LLERLRAEHAAHFVGGNGRAIANRAPRAEAQETRAEAQAQRLVEPARALGRVGRALEVARIFGCIRADGARRGAGVRTTAPGARVPHDGPDGDAEDGRCEGDRDALRDVREAATDPAGEAVHAVADPCQLVA